MQRSHRWLVLALSIAAAGATFLAWQERNSILGSAAHSWAVSSRLAPTDAIVVLGGSIERTTAAAQLYRSGLASRILVDDDDNQKRLLGSGIPAQAVELIGSGPRSTYEEACALRDWAGKNGTRRVVIPTEWSPARRVRWIFARELKGLGTKVTIDVISVGRYPIDDWWSNRASRDRFLSEIVKYFYYRMRYTFSHC